MTDKNIICEYGMCYIWERERERLDSLSINYVDW